MKSLYKDTHIGTHAVLLFFCMIAFGALYVNLFANRDDTLLNEFSVHQKNISNLVTMNWKIIFTQFFFMRILQLFFIVMFAYFLGAKWIFYIITGLAGIIFGIVVAVETMMLGACGMLYGIVIWLPQGIFYGVIYYMLYLRVKQGNVMGAFWDKKSQGMQFAGNSSPYMHKQMTGMLLQVVLAVTLIALGSVTEAYVNPRLILFCNQHIVPAIIL